MLGMKRTVIHRIQLHTFRSQLLAHKLHQQLKIRFRVISPRNPGLIRHHDKAITQSRRRPAKGEYPVNKPHFLDTMQISNLLVHHAIPIEK